MHYGAIRNSRGVAIIPPAGARGAGGGGAHGGCVSGLMLLLLLLAGLLNPAASWLLGSAADHDSCWLESCSQISALCHALWCCLLLAGPILLYNRGLYIYIVRVL